MNKFSIEKLKSFWHLPVRLKEQQQKTINAYSYDILLSYFKNIPAFPLTTWSMSPTALLHLLNYIMIYKPKSILEFGTGSSTIFLSQFIKEQKLGTKLISIDHNLDWINIVKANTVNSSEFVEFHKIDLTEKLNFKDNEFLWFNYDALDEILDKNNLDLVVIDAPIAYNNPYARAGAFLYLNKQIKDEKLIYFLDDANRIGEMEIAKNLGKHNQFGLDYVIGGKLLTFDSTPITYKK